MQIDELIGALEVASKAGIRSPDQFRAFLEIAKAGQTDILELSGAERSTDPEAKSTASIIRPLFEGTTVKASTGQMGIGLLRSKPGTICKKGGTKPYNSIVLSPKGKRLLKKLELDLT